DPIDTALTALRDRRPVIVVDDEDRENEGDLIMPATSMTPEWMGFIIRHSSGVVCAPMPAARAQALDLPPMTEVNEDAKGTAYTVTCDAATGITTGISAADRTVTVHTLAAEALDPTSVTRPGHVLPLIARDGRVRERPAHTEARVALCRPADAAEPAVIAAAVPTPRAGFRTRAWRPLAPQGRPGPEHLALEAPAPAEPGAASAAASADAAGTEPGAGGATALTGGDAPLVRVHSECLTGDAF